MTMKEEGGTNCDGRGPGTELRIVEIYVRDS
jgi:hypothetical protein